uniref:Uncharacterized protein LOC114341987 n=1 Tax=Diabrotica virgifera virgifera TaxID=50390 RepID=A0A6P7GXN1_DIAVI
MGDDSEQKLNKMMKMLENLITEIREIKQENSKQITELIDMNRVLTEENFRMKKDIELLATKVEKNERDKKRKNIVITGIETDNVGNKRLKEQAKSIMTDLLELQVDLKEVYSIGKNKCIIELKSFGDKLRVMEAKKKLKNHPHKRIYIDHDLTKKELETQSITKRRLCGNHEKVMQSFGLTWKFPFKVKFGKVTYKVASSYTVLGNGGSNFPPKPFNVVGVCAGNGIDKMFGVVNCLVNKSFM